MSNYDRSLIHNRLTNNDFRQIYFSSHIVKYLNIELKANRSKYVHFRRPDTRTPSIIVEDDDDEYWSKSSCKTICFCRMRREILLRDGNGWFVSVREFPSNSISAYHWRMKLDQSMSLDRRLQLTTARFSSEYHEYLQERIFTES